MPGSGLGLNYKNQKDVKDKNGREIEIMQVAEIVLIYAAILVSYVKQFLASVLPTPSKYETIIHCPFPAFSFFHFGRTISTIQQRNLYPSPFGSRAAKWEVGC